ncbi:MAG: glycosyltransferase family 2 protein [Promethearchaeota archaeon]
MHGSDPSAAPPLVSIVVPAYNYAHGIRDSIRSLFRQTYPEIEVVVVDDGSNDGTREVLRDWAEGGKIRYVYQENMGIGAARNRGIELARGEYVGFLDQDDFILPRMVEEKVRFLEEHPDHAMVFTNYRLFYKRTRQVSPPLWRGLRSPYTLEDLLRRNRIGNLTVLVRKSVLERVGGFPTNRTRTEDYDLWLRVVGVGKIGYLDDALGLWTLHSGNQTRDFTRTNVEVIQILLEYAREHELSGREVAALKANVQYSLFYPVREHLLAGKVRKALRLLLLGLRMGPARMVSTLVGRVATYFKLKRLWFPLVEL